jgi:Flp pilus assembly protein TadG
MMRTRSGSRRPRRPRPRCQRGAAATEFAIVLPVLVALLLGTVSAGLTYTNHIALTNAAREASRFGATRPVDATMSTWLAGVRDQAVRSATGSLNAPASTYVCVAYVHPAGTEASDRTTRLERFTGARAVGATPSTTGPCYDDGLPTTDRRVQVLVQRDAEIEALLVSPSVTLTGRSTSRFERA